jgi:DNA end-binding protein Ku
MPRASWKGFLRLSLVSCPVYLSPATTRAKSVRLHQVWVPSAAAGRVERSWADEEEEEPLARAGNVNARREPVEPAEVDEPEYPGPATRIALRPHDPHTGAAIERDEVRKGYEYDRGQFITFTPEELKTLDVESSKAIDLATFVPRADVDPLYFSTPYYVYPDGPVAVEPYRVIGAAMAETGMAGLGRLTLSRRERMVMLEPRGAGMALM